MEVMTALSVISFALIALLGVFPIGLENSRACVSETRAAQLGRMIVATLTSESFNAAPCFSQTLPPLDLTTIDTPDGASPAAILYVSYDVLESPTISRTETRPADAIYQVEMRCRPERFAVATPSRVTGSTVSLRITGLDAKQSIFESASFIGNFQRVAFAK